MANKASGMPIATMSENKASSPEWLLQSVIEKLQHRVALRSLADANMQSSWSDLAAAFPGFGVPTESAGATQKFHPADSIHDPSILGSPEDPTGPMVRSWSYWKRTTWGFESPRTACKFMSMKAWAEILRAKECTALISGNVCFFCLIYIYTIQIYTVHQFPPQVLIWIAHFTAFPCYPFKYPPPWRLGLQMFLPSQQNLEQNQPLWSYHFCACSHVCPSFPWFSMHFPSFSWPCCPPLCAI